MILPLQDTYTAVLLENAARDSTVTTLRVQDRDTGDHGLIRLTIAGEDSHTSAFRPVRRDMENGWWDVDIVTATVSGCAIDSVCVYVTGIVKILDQHLDFYCQYAYFICIFLNIGSINGCINYKSL